MFKTSPPANSLRNLSYDLQRDHIIYYLPFQYSVLNANLSKPSSYTVTQRIPNNKTSNKIQKCYVKLAQLVFLILVSNVQFGNPPLFQVESRNVAVVSKNLLFNFEVMNNPLIADRKEMKGSDNVAQTILSIAWT